MDSGITAYSNKYPKSKKDVDKLHHSIKDYENRIIVTNNNQEKKATACDQESLRYLQCLRNVKEVYDFKGYQKQPDTTTNNTFWAQYSAESCGRYYQDIEACKMQQYTTFAQQVQTLMAHVNTKERVRNEDTGAVTAQKVNLYDTTQEQLRNEKIEKMKKYKIPSSKIDDLLEYDAHYFQNYQRWKKENDQRLGRGDHDNNNNHPNNDTNNTTSSDQKHNNKHDTKNHFDDEEKRFLSKIKTTIDNSNNNIDVVRQEEKTSTATKEKTTTTTQQEETPLSSSSSSLLPSNYVPKLKEREQATTTTTTKKKDNDSNNDVLNTIKDKWKGFW